ncbi:hypothetical protein PILCRDRAFT_818814 [Piloderma croceum F 1598]|uniref:Uncharacterized protein n=1 Tax=Piloderma croceum (strain F 1598) TaxID=765440 RepID=A0A0C3FZX6_PILCF|nr:hypothetical protein PILCRDRAFT_818814 [Piloderma croceum F 1598]
MSIPTMVETTEDASSIIETARKALQANKDHQYALKVYTERLEAELRAIDKMLDTADILDEDEEPELDAGGSVHVPSAVKAVFPIHPNEFLSEDSPFREDALRRTRYVNNTAIHPMKAKELEVLAEAIRTENHRKRALEAQKGGLPSFAPRDDTSQNFFEWNTDGIDWGRVAEKVSSVASLPRTARDCAIRWLGDRHPQFLHTPWTPTELAKLQDLVKNAPEGPIDWVEIASSLGNTRTPLDCMRHGIHRNQHAWTPESDDALLNAVSIYGTDNWILVATRVSEDATPQQCQNRYSRTLDPTLRHGAWTAEEDAKLRLAVSVFGNSWMEVAEVIAGRNNEQCRDRWSDKINRKWTDDEDRALLEAVGNLGTSNWKGVSECLSNRTEQDCRSRYDKVLQKQNKKPKARTTTPGKHTETQADGSGSSSAPARPRPRPRARKGPPAESEVTDHDKEQSAESSRPKPRPRTKTSKGTAEEHEIVDGEPIPQAVVEKGKGKGKQKAATVASIEAKSTRKRKRQTGDNISDNLPLKRKKVGSAVVPESDNQAEAVATRQANEDDGTSLASHEVAPNQVATARALGQGKEAARTKVKGDPRGETTVRTAEPTRRQPPRAAARKSIS